MKRSTSASSAGAHDRVVERGVDLRERVREPVEVGDPADDRGEVDHVRAALRGPPRLRELAQVAGVDLAPLAHPLWRGPLVGDPHLVGGVGEQPANDRRADRAGASCDQYPAHVSRGVLLGDRPRG